MKHPPCGVCPHPVKMNEVVLNLTTKHGRPVVIVLHEGCATALLGGVSVQSRQRESDRLKLAKRARAEAGRVLWGPREIRGVRARMNMTQTEMAKYLGVSRQSIYGHEQEDAGYWFGMSHKLINLEALAAQQSGVTLKDYLAERQNDGTSDVGRDETRTTRQGAGAVREGDGRASARRP